MDLNTVLGLILIFLGLFFVFFITLRSRWIIGKIDAEPWVSVRQAIRDLYGQ